MRKSHRAAIERPRLNRGLCAAVSLILYLRDARWATYRKCAGDFTQPPSSCLPIIRCRMGNGTRSLLLCASISGNGGAETKPLDLNADFVRGDEWVPDLVVNSAIAVYLHGDCTLLPASRTEPLYGAGWAGYAGRRPHRALRSRGLHANRKGARPGSDVAEQSKVCRSHG